MSLNIGMFTTPRATRLVVSPASGPDPRKYVLDGLAGAISSGSLRSVMTLENAEACFQPDVTTYLDSFSIVSMNCAASVFVPNVKNTSSYHLVGARNVFFFVVEALFAGPNFFQGFFTFFVILHMLEFIGIMLMEHYTCSSTLLFDRM